MRKTNKNKIIIDMDKWCTSGSKAKELGITRQAIHGLIERKSIEAWRIPELNDLLLVDKSFRSAEKNNSS